MHYFYKALRQFETDADLFDHQAKIELGTTAKGLIFKESEDTTDEDEIEKRRPYRIIIEKLNTMEPSKLTKVSYRSKMLQHVVKVPMVLLILSAAFISGCSVLLLKIVDTILQMGDWQEHCILVVLLILGMLYTGDTQLQFLNLAIQLYDQLEVVPIYQTFILFAWTSIGLVLYNEYVFYTTEQICGLFGAAFVCLVGVKTLTMKHKQEKNEDEKLTK